MQYTTTLPSFSATIMKKLFISALLVAAVTSFAQYPGRPPTVLTTPATAGTDSNAVWNISVVAANSVGGATNGIPKLSGFGTNTVLYNVSIASLSSNIPGNITGNAATATRATNAPTGATIADVNQVTNTAVQLQNQQGDFLEDFTLWPNQVPWTTHTNWGMSTYSDSQTNWVMITNSGYGGELLFPTNISVYFSHTNQYAITSMELDTRTYRTGTNISDYYGGAAVFLIGTNYVGLDGLNGGPTLSGWNAHIIFRTYSFAMSLWTNGGNGWIGSPNGDVAYEPGPIWTNGLSTCGFRKLAPNTWQIYRDGITYNWVCDGLTNLAGANVGTVQHWRSADGTGEIPSDVAFKRVRISSKPQPAFAPSTSKTYKQNIIPLASCSYWRWPGGGATDPIYYKNPNASGIVPFNGTADYIDSVDPTYDFVVSTRLPNTVTQAVGSLWFYAKTNDLFQTYYYTSAYQTATNGEQLGYSTSMYVGGPMKTTYEVRWTNSWSGAALLQPKIMRIYCGVNSNYPSGSGFYSGGRAIVGWNVYTMDYNDP